MANEKILVIDDNPDLVGVIKLTLEANDYQVFSAASGTEGLEKVKEVNPDLIILDMIMNYITEGIQVALQLRDPDPKSEYAPYCKIPILMLTAVHSKTPLRFTADEKHLPVDDFAEKPLEASALLQKVENLLGKRQKGSKMREQKIKIGGIIRNRNLAKIGVMSVPDRPGVGGAIFSALGERGINVPFIVHTIDLNNLDNIVICVAQEDLTAALEALDTVQDALGAKEIVYDGEVGIVSMFGPHFGERPGIAGVMFSALASAGINILAISTSISSTSCLLDASDIDEAVRALEEAFELP